MLCNIHFLNSFSPHLDTFNFPFSLNIYKSKVSNESVSKIGHRRCPVVQCIIKYLLSFTITLQKEKKDHEHYNNYTAMIHYCLLRHRLRCVLLCFSRLIRDRTDCQTLKLTFAVICFHYDSFQVVYQLYQRIHK